MKDFLIITILTLYIMAVFIIGFLSLLLTEDMKLCLLTPSEIHKNTNLNWFGCIFVWFLELIINPIIWIGIVIVKIFKWLFKRRR